MRDYAPKIVGGLLVLCGLVLLVFGPGKFSSPHLILGIGTLVVGGLLLWGLIGTAPRVARIRREALAETRQLDVPEIPERVFRYSPGRAVNVVLVSVALLMFVLGTVVAAGLEDSGQGLWLVGGAMWAVGLLVLWLAYRYPRLYVKVDSRGVESQQYVRTVAMTWPDILALTISYEGMLTYSVWSRRYKLSFNSGIEGADELVVLLASVTGLEWE